MSLWTDALLLAGGAAAGFINAVAGGGSALTLPLLMLTGLDASVANGTNRVAVAVQAATGTVTFHRSGVRPWRAAVYALAPSMAGALIGAVVATHLAPPTMEIAFGVIFLGLAVLLALKPSFLDPPAEAEPRPIGMGGGLALFAVGFYGGLFQAGVGIPLLVVLVRVTGLDLVRSNAMKLGLVCVYTTAVLAIFGSAGQLEWRAGAVLAAGGLVGSSLGARAAVVRGAPFIRRLVMLALVLAAAKALGLFNLLKPG
ncbi:MAG: sulfite exporter TauE/SafE family protein [Myxococcales bacterium]|nr:sulfite exporter TauE/SafE family protein [Myxococcales bacterium]